MSTQFRHGPGAGQVSPAKLKTALLWIVIGALAFIGLVILAIHMVSIRMHPVQAGAGPAVATSDPDTQPVTLTETNWHGIGNIDQSKQLHYQLLTRAVWTVTRLDHSDSLLFTNYPADWSTNVTVQYPPSNYMEMMVLPGQRPGRSLTAECLLMRIPYVRPRNT